MPLELRDALYLSAVHSYFFDVCNAQTSLLQRMRTIMNILHDCGYTLLRDALDVIDNCNSDNNSNGKNSNSNEMSAEQEEIYKSAVEELKIGIVSSMETVKSNKVGNTRKRHMSCAQLFWMHSCHHLLTDNTNITLHSLVESFLSTNAKLSQDDTRALSNMEGLWWKSLITSASSSQITNNTGSGAQDVVNNTILADIENKMIVNDNKPLFIPVFIDGNTHNESIDSEVSKENAYGHKQDKHTQHSSKSNQLINSFNCARLYSALLCAMNAHAGTVTPMSKLLIIYIFQQQEYSENGLSDEQHNTEISDWLALCMTRAKGVVAGIVEYSLMCSRTSTHCTINELDLLANTATDSNTQPSASLESHELQEEREKEHYKINDKYSANISDENANHKTTMPLQDCWLDKFAEPTNMSDVKVSSQMAAITLSRLTEQCELLVNSLKAGNNTHASNWVSDCLHYLCSKANALHSSTHLSESIAVAVTHVIQELLYTLVLGRSTQFMISRPEYTYDPSAMTAINNKKPRDINSFSSYSNTSTSIKHARSELFKPTSVSSSATTTSSPRKQHSTLANSNNTFLCDELSVVTSRGLGLAEADGLLLNLFPTILQQTGYEWPWSALLKQLRALDKEHNRHLNNDENVREIIKSGKCNCGVSVRWSSRCVIEMLLLRLATSFTYPARLANLLPSSYDRIVESIGLFRHQSTTMLQSFAQQTGKHVNEKNKNNNENDISLNDKKDENNNSYSSIMFDLPAYYKEAATPVLSYVCSAASRISVHEVERILIESTSALPMTARLRTLVARTGNHTNGSNTEKYNLRTEEEELLEEEQEEEEEEEKEEEMPKRVKSRTEATTTTTTIARLVRELHLSAVRVNGWEWRYRLEVLMSVIIVYTQLATPSALQQLIRTLQPLIATALTAMREAKLTEGVELIARTSVTRKVKDAHFTREAEVLINYVNYQFYTLEWLPMVAHIYHTSLIAHNASKTTSVTSNQTNVYQNSYYDLHSAFATQCVYPYSVAAAMAHQFNLHIKSNVNTTLSSVDTFQQHYWEEQRWEQQVAPLPIQSNQEDKMAVPLNNFTTLTAYVTSFSGIEPNELKRKINHNSSNSKNRELSPYREYQRVHRFMNHFIHACYLVSLTSPCELEGPLAVSATRKIGSHSANEIVIASSSSTYASGNYTTTTNSYVHNYSSSSALSILRSTYADVLNARCYRQWCNDAREVRESGHHELCDTTKCQIKMNSNSINDTHKSIKDVASVERIGQALLQFGAHSFSDVLQATDGLLACLQCFLPSSVLVHEWTSSLNASVSHNKEIKKNNTNDKNNSMNVSSQFNVSCTDILLNAAWQWCESTLVPYSQSGQLQSLQAIQNSIYNTEHNPQANKDCAYNSCTFDAAPLSREMIRRLLHQLLVKMQERLDMQQIIYEVRKYHHLQHSALNSDKPQKDENSVCKVSVDSFLLHQWRQLRILLHTLTLCNTEPLSSHVSNALNNSALLSTYYMWHSPFFADEFELENQESVGALKIERK